MRNHIGVLVGTYDMGDLVLDQLPCPHYLRQLRHRNAPFHRFL
jgi:hypothetical protein